jgi:hybrid cluster-associated redox disulfide protein
MKLDSNMTVKELMTHHPSVIDVFIKRKMLCIGCQTETFHTIEDVACINGILLKHFLKDLRDAIDAQGESRED